METKTVNVKAEVGGQEDSEERLFVASRSLKDVADAYGHVATTITLKRSHGDVTMGLDMLLSDAAMVDPGGGVKGRPLVFRVQQAGGGQQGVGVGAGAVAGASASSVPTAGISGVGAATSIVAMSKVGSTVWNRIIRASGLQVRTVSRLQPKERQVTPFEWDARPEYQQKQEYLAHLSTILQLPADYGVYDADSFPQLLDWSESLGNPPIRLTGTTDALICSEAASMLPQFDLVVLFEVKKKVERRHIYQAMAEELSAELLPGTHASPVSVLTDLRDSWGILWMDGKTMWHFKATAASAMGFIDSVVARAVQQQSSMDAAVPVPEDAPLAQVHKRARLTLPGDVEEMDVAPLHDLVDFGVMPEAERRAALHHTLQMDLWRLCARAFSSPDEAGPPPSMY